MNYIAYCTKGLERVVVNEMVSEIPDVKIEEEFAKRIVFQSNSDFKSLVNLRTVDDLGLLIAKLDRVSSIEEVISTIDKLDLLQIFKTLSTYREVKPNEFSITSSLAGVENFSASKLVQALANEISNNYKWRYKELNHSNFDIRVFIDHEVGYISVRLTEESLRNRPYKTSSKLGSLKPTIAAAMVKIAAQGKSNLKIVDNFCGSGTILCEALLLGNKVYGGDIDNESVILSKSNLSNLKYYSEDKIKQLDAMKTNWQSIFFDSAVSNLPWNKQVKIESITRLYEGTLKEYKRIVKSKGTICLLASKPDLLIKHAKKIMPNSVIRSIKIGLLGQNPSIVAINLV